MRKRLLLAAFVSLGVIGILMGSALLLSQERITPRTYERLRVGMHEPEVRSILGEPTPDTRLSWGDVRHGDGKWVKCWMGERFTIAVAFDASGVATDTIFVDELQLKIGLTWWDKARLKLGW